VWLGGGLSFELAIDSELLQSANLAVSEGRAESVSGWVNLALAERAARERRLRALAAAVVTFERDFGEITAAELAAQERADRGRARVVRGPKRQMKR
jgi:hypothetical protein